MEKIEKVVLTNPVEDVEIFRKDKYGNEYMGFIHGSDGIKTTVEIEELGTNYVISVVINGNLICSYHNVDSYKINVKEVENNEG